MILVRRIEVGLVADVHDRGDVSAISAQVLLGSAWLEDVVKPGLERFGSSHEFDESLHVVRYGKGIFCVIVSDTTRSMIFTVTASVFVSVSIGQLPQNLDAKTMMAPIEIEWRINLSKGVAS